MSYPTNIELLETEYEKFIKSVSTSLIERSLSNSWITKDHVDVASITDTVKCADRLGMNISNKARKLGIERAKAIASSKLSIVRHQNKLRDQQDELSKIEQELVTSTSTSSSINDSLMQILQDVDIDTYRNIDQQDLDDLFISLKNLPVNPVKEQFSEIFKTWQGFKHKLSQIVNLVANPNKRYAKTLVSLRKFNYLLNLLLSTRIKSEVFNTLTDTYSNSLNEDDKQILIQCLDTQTFYDKKIWFILCNFITYARSQVVSPLTKLKHEIIIKKETINTLTLELSEFEIVLKDQDLDILWTKKLFDLSQYLEPPSLFLSMCLLGLSQELGHPDFPKHFCDLCFKHLKNLNPASVDFIKKYAENEIHGTVQQRHFDTIGVSCRANA